MLSPELVCCPPNWSPELDKIRVSLFASNFPHLFPVFLPSLNTLVNDESNKAGLTFTRVVNDEGAVWVN